jgi:hypothetical protein
MGNPGNESLHTDEKVRVFQIKFRKLSAGRNQMCNRSNAFAKSAAYEVS